METIGQLTGGVAHDFNDLLMAVMGNLGLLRKRLPDDPRLRRLIDGALQGAERGASLTRGCWPSRGSRICGPCRSICGP